MKISLTKRVLVLFSLMAVIVSCSDDDTPNSGDPAPEENTYCIMFYLSGGDEEHDILLFNSFAEAAAGTAGCPHVAVTGLFCTSGTGEGSEHNGTRRYTAADGRLEEDVSFRPGTDFRITDPARLSEFIRWSAQRYPARKYLFVFGGHGSIWRPELDLSADAATDANAVTRATLFDGERLMTSAELAKGVKDSGIAFEAMIAHSCQQGSIEMLAEWEGIADYLLGSSLSIPDLGYEYGSLMRDLEGGIPVREALAKTAERAMNIWQEYADGAYFDTAISVTDLRDLKALWDLLGTTFAYMQESMDTVGLVVDPPAVSGNPYYRGYYEAFGYVVQHAAGMLPSDMTSDVVDLPTYLRAAVIHSGNLNLIPYVNRLDALLDTLLVVHLQSNKSDNHTYNILWSDYYFSDEEIGAYRTCRFDRLTRWSDFREKLMKKLSAEL